MSYVNDCCLIETGYGFSMNGENLFGRNHYIPYQALPTYLQEKGNYSIFASAYRYDNLDIKHANLYGNFYLDFDNKDDFEKVREDALNALYYLNVGYGIDKKFIQIYFSGNKGIHLIVPANVFGFEPMQELNNIFKMIATSIRAFTAFETIDLKIYDNKRLFRIPNTIHEVSHLYKIPLTITELESLSINEIKELAQKPREMEFERTTIIESARKQFEKDKREFLLLKKKKITEEKRKKKINYTPPCIQFILKNGAETGERNTTIACLSSFYRDFGLSLNEIITTITEWNSNNKNPIHEHELERTVKSIFYSEKTYGCTTLSYLSNCNKKLCRFKNKTERRKR